MQIAIIGAGMAGLSCADTLRGAGHDVFLFDKGRGPGGRMATRRLQTAWGQVALDHGAQYFTARDPAFLELIRSWHVSGIVAPWPLAAADAWVGVPGMSAVIRHMASVHRVAWGNLVSAMSRKLGQWWLTTAQGEAGPFDAVVVAIPAEQAAAILSLHDFALAQKALLARSQPCWTGMYIFDRPLDGLPPVIRHRGDIAWAARNNAKPGRSGPEAWVVQANGGWSESLLEHENDAIAARLLAALREVTGVTLAEPVAAVAHRWRFALSAGTGTGALWNPAIGLGACGDWLLGPRVECAWLSGRQLAGRILADLPLGAADQMSNVRM
jgi:renalase